MPLTDEERNQLAAEIARFHDVTKESAMDYDVGLDDAIGVVKSFGRDKAYELSEFLPMLIDAAAEKLVAAILGPYENLSKIRLVESEDE